MNETSWPFPGDRDRQIRAAVRLRIAMHAWEEDLTNFTEALEGSVKLGAMAIIDHSDNLLASLAKQLSVPGVYGDAPDVYPPAGGEVLVGAAADRGGDMDSYMARASWAALMPTVDYFVRALGCVAVVPSVDADYLDDPAGPLAFRLAWPHDLHVEVHRDRPTVPLVLWERRSVPDTSGATPYPQTKIVFYRWDVTDPTAPSFTILDDTLKKNITAEVWPEAAGAYPWRYTGGRPYIPHTFYRLGTGDFWGDSDLRAIQRGTFHGAVTTNIAHYATRKATAQPAYLLNCTPTGSKSTSPLSLNGVRTLDLLPGAHLELELMDSEKPAQVIVAGPGIDPGVIYRAGGDYASRLLSAYGLSGASSTRDHANPTSAAALSIHDTDKRLQQRVGSEAYRGSDLTVIGKCAALMNGILDGAPLIPEVGYRIGYHFLPLTPGELAEQRDDITFDLANGLTSRVDAYILRNPGTDRPTALAALRRIREDEAALELADEDTEDEDTTDPSAPPPPGVEDPDIEDDNPND